MIRFKNNYSSLRIFPLKFKIIHCKLIIGSTFRNLSTKSYLNNSFLTNSSEEKKLELKLSALINNGKAEEAGNLFDEYHKKGLILTTKLYTMLFSGLKKQGLRPSFETIMNFVDQMKAHGIKPDLKTYSSILNCLKGYRGEEKILKITTFFEEMKKNVKLDEEAYVFLFNSLISSNSLHLVMKYFEEMKSSGLNPGIESYHCILKAFISKGDTKEMIKWFESMSERNLSTPLTYNIVLDALSKTKETNLMVKYFNEMVPPFLEPNNFTYKVMIKGFGNAGDIKSMLEYYEKMKQNNLLDISTFYILSDFLKKFGENRKILKLKEEMKETGILK